MKRFLKRLAVRFLNVHPQRPEVYVVMTTKNEADSVWFSLPRAIEHVTEMNKICEKNDADFRLLKPQRETHGTFILDSQRGVYSLGN
jgi:hypothetical protein